MDEGDRSGSVQGAGGQVPSPGGCPGSRRTGPRRGAATARTADYGGGLSPGAGGSGTVCDRLRQGLRARRAPALGGVGEEDAGAGFGVREGAVVVWWSRRAQTRDGPRGPVPPLSLATRTICTFSYASAPPSTSGLRRGPRPRPSRAASGR